jgi:hypothetical protein
VTAVRNEEGSEHSSSLRRMREAGLPDKEAKVAVCIFKEHRSMGQFVKDKTAPRIQEVRKTGKNSGC